MLPPAMAMTAAPRRTPAVNNRRIAPPDRASCVYLTNVEAAIAYVSRSSTKPL